ncbi:early endosome antigen 1-like isoform X2 [Branchiostoma floridae]|uniref:Early endosome antigen 1-like isoform X2 n=1 Tax=Branchiostoma floridae TaxID=7739 RepID=A0A9J7MJS4_BRAFL|nr:early endosome antigen 1-like isoform X2 [Branchiostoma floridae]
MADGTAASTEGVPAEDRSLDSCSGDVPSNTTTDIPTIAVSPCDNMDKEPDGYRFGPNSDDTDETMNLVNMPSMFVPCYPGNKVNDHEEEEEDTMQILGEASAFVRETLGDPAPPSEGMEASSTASVSSADRTKPEAVQGGQNGFSTSVGRYVDGVIAQAVTNVLEDQFKTSGYSVEDEAASEDELTESSPCRNLQDIAAELQADLSYSSPLPQASVMTVSKMGESQSSPAGKVPPSTDTGTAGGFSTVNVEVPPSPVAHAAGDSTLDDEAVAAEAPSSPVTHTAGNSTISDEDVGAFVDDIITSAAEQLQPTPSCAPWRNLHGIAVQLQADLSFSSPVQPPSKARENAPDSDSTRGMEVATRDAHSVIDHAFQFLDEQDQRVTEETVTMATADGREQPVTAETAPMATPKDQAVSMETVTMDTQSSPPATPEKLTDSATAMSPVAMVVKETEMTPKRHISVATATTPARLVTMAVGTSPVATVSKETGMTPTKFCDAAAGTTPIQQVTMETVMTPVRVMEEGTATTPGLVPHMTTGTAMTPGQETLQDDSETVDFSTLDESGVRRRAQTLAISNELLRNDVRALREDRAKLSQSVNTLQQRLENSNADLRADVARLAVEKGEQAALIGQLKKKNSQLEEDLLRSYQQHKAELSGVTHERDRYCRQLERSQVEMMQLEEDLQVYIDMFQEMEETKDFNNDNTQLNKECAEHLQEMVTNVEKDRESLLQERGELDRLRDDCDRRTKDLAEREEAMLAENKRLKFIAEDAERKESQTNEDLFATMSQVSDLSADVALLTAAEQEASTKLQEAVSRCEALQRETEEKGAELVGLQATLSLQEMENVTLQERLRESESKLSKLNEQLDAEFERFETEMQTTSNNLQAANQEREQLRRDLENCLSIMEENERVAKQQKQELEAKDEIQAQLYRCREQLEASEAQYHEQLAFHEAERDTQSESLRETEEALSQETERAQKFQRECEDRQKALVTLQGDTQELKAKLSETLQELDSIKTSAQHMLLQQGQEMQATREELGAVQGRLEGLANSLKDRIGAGKEAKEMPAVAMATPAKVAPGNGSLVTPAKAVSLVSSIMYAVRETVMGTPSPRPDRHNAASSEEQNTTQDAVDQLESSSEEEAGKEKEPDQSEQSLVSQTEAVSALVTRVLGMMKMLEKASDLALSDLQTENMTLKRKLGRIHEDHDGAIHDVTSDLMQSEQREEKLRVELNLKREELTAVQQALEYSKDKLTQLSDNMGSLSDAQATCKKQTAELEKLRVNLRSREEENRLLKEELESALGQRSHHGHSSRGSDVTLVKERIALKAEVTELRLKLMDKEEEMNQVLATANRRMKAHENNQQKAENEVCRLDNIIEAIRKTLHKHNDIVQTCHELAELLQDLDGDSNSGEVFV